MTARSALLFIALGIASAQTQPAFEVASVKPANPTDGAISRRNYGEFMGNLHFLISAAYGVDDYRITGGPKWLDADKFSVNYKPVGPQAALMLRTLLADRFKLAVHMETKELPIYSLVVAKTGPKMEKADKPVSTGSGAGKFSGTMEMSTLVSYLSSIVGRGVVDNTGLKGAYTFTLKWTPDDRPASGSDSPPSLPTAIQEQLGLKLESKKGSVDILVIDHAEKPSEN